MDEEFLTLLGQHGVDTKTTLERFMGNGAMYERFLMKFLKDDNFASLKQDLIDKGYDAALGHAHTLKGVCGNLGMTDLFADLAEMVRLFRAKQPEQAAAMFDGLQKKYEDLCAVLKERQSKAGGVTSRAWEG